MIATSFRRPMAPPARARGAVLFVALIMLILLTLLGLTAAQVTVLQERMSGNFRVQQLSFERSEGRMAAARDIVYNPLVVYDTVSNVPVELMPSSSATPNAWPWNAWLAAGPPAEYPPSGSTAPLTTLMLGVHACGGACPQQQGSAVGEDPNRKPRFYVITAQQKDMPATDPSIAAWSTVQTIYVH